MPFLTRAVILGFAILPALALAPPASTDEIIATVPAGEMARTMLEQPRVRLEVLRVFAAGLVHGGVDAPASRYIVAVGRAMGTQLGRRGGPWTDADIDSWLSVLLVDSKRFVTDESFRQTVVANLPRAVSPLLPHELRGLILIAINRTPGIDFDTSERIDLAVGAARRSSVDHELAFRPDGLTVRHNGAIVTSLFSLPSAYYRPYEVQDFLAALEKLAPEREILVLADARMLDELPAEFGKHVHLLDTHGRPYSPWVRDPVLLARDAEGSVVILQRRYEQEGREADGYLAREIIEQLPDDAAEVWAGVSWMEADTPFHNGQILVVGETIWISIHTLGRAIVERLGVGAVPTSALADPQVLDRLMDAVDAAAVDLGRLFGSKVSFVHPLPRRGRSDARIALMQTIIGGGGYDLDSLVTLLPGPDGTAAAALVGDIGRGDALLDGLEDDEFEAFRRGYRLRDDPLGLRAQLLAYQRSEHGRRLQAFLDLMATALADEGLQVQRLPLLLTPTAALADRGLIRHEDFVVNWNNVVLETAPGVARAEGFASLIPTGDEIARAAFAQAGYSLDLLPPLVTSIIRNGGYRCSSNHLTARSTTGF